MTNDQGLDISIEYCAECGYFSRVAWLLGEVMGDIQHDVKRVTIIPSGGGRHEWKVNGAVVWSKAAEDRHPDVDELKGIAAGAKVPSFKVNNQAYSNFKLFYFCCTTLPLASTQCPLVDAL